MYVCYIYVCVYIYLNHFAIQLKLTHAINQLFVVVVAQSLSQV